MELLRTHTRRSVLSETIYILLNIGLALVVLGLILILQSPWLAIVAVFMSKWRIFAVRPRYWMAHIQANLVDMIVGVGLAILMFVALGSLGLQVALTVVYILWLLFVKPRSKHVYVLAQAGTAIFIGISALTAISYDAWASLFVLGMWLIGYATARHILLLYEEAHRSFLSLAWGFLFAEFGWLFYHWTFAYALPGFGNVKIAQSAVIMLAMSFFAYKAYASYDKYQEIRMNDVAMPLLLSVGVSIVLLLIFNAIPAGGS